MKLELMKLSAIKAACSEAHSEAQNEWRKEHGRRGCLFSRGRELAAQVRMPNGAEQNVLEAGAWPWDGTLKALHDAAARASQSGELLCLSIDGGIDYAESPRAYRDGEYDPWVTDWSVPVWTKEPTDNYGGRCPVCGNHTETTYPGTVQCSHTGCDGIVHVHKLKETQ